MNRTGLIAMCMGVVLAAGCANPQAAKKEAHERWSLAKNKIYFQLALDQYQAGKTEECKAQLNRILASPQPFGPALLLAAKVAMKEKRYGQAEAYISEATALLPNSAEAWYGTALLKEMDGDLDSALKAMHQATVLDPNDADYLICLAELQVKQGESDKALATLSEMQMRFQHHVGLQSALADLYVLNGQYGQASTCLRRILREEPGDTGVRDRLGVALARDGQTGQAIPLLVRQLESAKDGEKLVLREALADAYVQEGKFQNAEAEYVRLCKWQPGNVSWNFRLAECYVTMNQDDVALGRLLHVLELDPRHADAQALTGYLYYAKGDLPRAEEHCRQAIDHASDATLVAVVLTKTLKAMGRDDESREVWAEFGGRIQTAKAKGSLGRTAGANSSKFRMGGQGLSVESQAERQ